MPTKKFLFRVDAGGKVGLGHFFRSLNLANELRNKGHFVEFIHKASDFWDRQTSIGFHHLSLGSGDENEETLDHLRKGKFDTLYVDGILDFEAESFYEIKKLAKVVFYQNLSSSRCLADVFILPSIHQGSRFFSVFHKETKIYQGLEYFIFNQAIAALKVKNNNGSTEVRQVGIISGGSDPENVLLRLYEMIDHDKFSSVQFVYYPGINYMHPHTIPSEFPDNVRFEPYDPKEIMRCDLLLSAFGVSTYEFMYLGMPILSFGHQKSNALASRILAEKTGAAFHLGEINEIKSNELNFQLDRFMGQSETRQSLISNAKAILDLDGVNRVATILANE